MLTEVAAVVDDDIDGAHLAVRIEQTIAVELAAFVNPDAVFLERTFIVEVEAMNGAIRETGFPHPQ